MKKVHTSKKNSRRPFTGVKPNHKYNWHTTKISTKAGVKDFYLQPFAKLPLPTYKNKLNK